MYIEKYKNTIECTKSKFRFFYQHANHVYAKALAKSNQILCIYLVSLCVRTFILIHISGIFSLFHWHLMRFFVVFFSCSLICQLICCTGLFALKKYEAHKHEHNACYYSKRRCDGIRTIREPSNKSEEIKSQQVKRVARLKQNRKMKLHYEFVVFLLQPFICCRCVFFFPVKCRFVSNRKKDTLTEYSRTVCSTTRLLQ